jgi:tRNA(adenine34) deaminase
MKSQEKAGKKWSADVTTSSTRPPEGLFTKSAAVIARSLASKKISPKGPASGLRMLTFCINRAGKEFTNSRRKELERAKDLLSHRIRRQETTHNLLLPEGRLEAV